MQSRQFQQMRHKTNDLRATMHFDHENCDIPKQMDSNMWLEYCQRNPPLLRTLLHINQRNLEALVELQLSWMSDDLAWYTKNADWFPKWVYSSLVCLRLPLEGRVISNLRQIARTAIKLRRQFKRNQFQKAAPLNLIISIVTRNFYQSDLDCKI